MHTSAHPSAPPAPVPSAHHAHLCVPDGTASPGAHRAHPRAPDGTTSSHTQPCVPDGTTSPSAHPGTPRPVFTAAMCARTPHCSQPAWEPSRFLRWSFQVFLSFLRLPVIFSGLLLQGPCESALDVPAQTRCSFSLSPMSLRLTVILSSLFPPFLHFWVLFWGPPSTSPTQLSQLCY